MKKNEEILRITGILVFILLSGIIVLIVHFRNNRTFSQERTFPINQSIDIQKVKENMEEMSQAEIEETIKTIEAEIERLKSSI